MESLNRPSAATTAPFPTLKEPDPDTLLPHFTGKASVSQASMLG